MQNPGPFIIYLNSLSNLYQTIGQSAYADFALAAALSSSLDTNTVPARSPRDVYKRQAFSHPDVTATISEGNIWDFHGGEMETSMVMAVDPSLVKLDTSEAGIPTAFKDNQALKPYGSVSIGWVSEDWKTADGKPIGIGGDPSGATAEKGRIILETSAKVLVPGLREIRAWKG